MLIENKKDVIDEHDYPRSNPRSRTSVVESLEERYDISKENNEHYWEDIAGAALVDKEILSDIQGSKLEEFQWAMDQDYSPSTQRLAGYAAGAGIGLSALFTNSEVFLDNAINARDVAGTGVAASTMLLGYSIKQGLETIGDYVSELPETTDNYESAIDDALDKVGSETEMGPIESIRTDIKYADPEVKGRVDFSDILDTDGEALDSLPREMERVYKEVNAEDNV